MQQYLDLMRHVRENGIKKTDRTGTGTLSVFGHMMRFDLREGFPLVTTKKIHTRSMIYELLWFIGGGTNVDYLNRHGVTIWDEWANEEGELGPIYGKQWRDWRRADGTQVDQLQLAINRLREQPDCRRIIVSAWNVAELHEMALMPCHLLYQFNVNDGRLSCLCYQRSCDVFLGVPFNIASYALLTHMVAALSDLEVGDLVWTGGDCHLYLNHLEQADAQLEREPRPLPALTLLHRPSISEYRYEDVIIEGYHPHPHIPAPISV